VLEAIDVADPPERRAFGLDAVAVGTYRVSLVVDVEQAKGELYVPVILDRRFPVPHQSHPIVRVNGVLPTLSSQLVYAPARPTQIGPVHAEEVTGGVRLEDRVFYVLKQRPRPEILKTDPLLNPVHGIPQALTVIRTDFVEDLVNVIHQGRDLFERAQASDKRLHVLPHPAKKYCKSTGDCSQHYEPSVGVEFWKSQEDTSRLTTTTVFSISWRVVPN